MKIILNLSETLHKFGSLFQFEKITEMQITEMPVLLNDFSINDGLLRGGDVLIDDKLDNSG